MKKWNAGQRITKDAASPDFLQYLAGLERDLAALQAKFDAIAAVTAPTGGATIDAQARTAINAIRTAAT